jgi:hypothetical protein
VQLWGEDAVNKDLMEMVNSSEGIKREGGFE